MIKNVFFDLDGTLLPMDMKTFVDGYMRLLAAFMARRGVDPARLVKAVWAGINDVLKNDGSGTNEEVFWESYARVCPVRPGDLEAVGLFYRTEFEKAREYCGFAPEAAATVREISGMGLRTVLATNPVFPREATLARVRWAGLEPGDFELITTYENSRWCKPNVLYFREICEKLGTDPTETLMVGNDTGDDIAGEALGMRTFFLTHSLIDPTGQAALRPHGGFGELLEYISENKNGEDDYGKI